MGALLLRRLTAIGLMSAVSFFGTTVVGQTIGGAVTDHVRDGVKKQKKQKKQKKKKKKKKQTRQKHRGPQSGPAPVRSTAPAPAPAPAPTGPKLPRRVIGKHFRLDPQVGLGYRGWQPQQYDAVKVETGSYLTGRLELQATFFGVLKLNRGFYESNALASPRRTDATVAAKAGNALPKVAVVLGSISVPFDFIWEPMVSYEAYSFEATARPRRPVQIIPHGASRNDDLGDMTRFPETTRDLILEARFETFVIGARYQPGKDKSGLVGDDLRSKIPPFYLGIGYTGYSKPYQVNVQGLTLDGLLFDARFRGLGLAFGVDTPKNADAFFLEFRGQFGLGEIKLLQDFTINEALPDNWLIGYTRGDATLGYLFPLTRTKPTLMLGASISGGGATFFAFKTVSSEEEDATVPPLNWDAFWGVQAFVVLPL